MFFSPYNLRTMANTTIGVGAVLLLLGLGGYLGSGMASPTALIPAVFGVLLVLLGLMARNPAKRKMAMHVAVIVAVIGFAGSARGLGGAAMMLSGQPVERPAAVIAQSIMAVLTLVFTLLCIRSFINARRGGTMEEVR